MRRTCAARDEDIFRPQQGGTVLARHLDGVGIQQLALSFDHGDPVAVKLRLDHLDLARHHRLRAEVEILHRDLVFEGVAAAIKRALAKAAQVEHRFTKCFAGNGSRVHAHASDGAGALDDGDVLAQLGRADGSLLARRPAADHHQVVALRLFHG